jgi:predicted amino acid racemase
MAGKRNPKLIVDLSKLRHNISKVRRMCIENGVEMAGVIKGCSGIPECAAQFEAAGCKYIASSRLEQLEPLKDFGIQTQLMLIRIPEISEAADVVKVTDYSLNSELEVLEALNREARKQDKKHKVILMADLGDLREGFWDRDELVEVALKVENEMQNLELAGVGTNLGCYGAIRPTVDNLQGLVNIAESIEEAIGRELEIISGGATSSLTTMMDGKLPKRINLLRVGEGVLNAIDLQKEPWGYDMNYLYKDAFTLRAEVIEVKDKPSHPVGEIMIDCFGNTPTFEDHGVRKRALVAIGKVDYAYIDELAVKDKNIKILGASSDHTILDVEDIDYDIRVGDIVEFELCYATLVFVSQSRNVERVFI